MRKLLDSRVQNTKNSLINKPSRGLTVVHTRIVTNSTKKRYTDAKHDNKVVGNNNKTVPEGVGAPEVIKCKFCSSEDIIFLLTIQCCLASPPIRV